LTSVIGFNKEPYKLYDHSIAFFDSNSHISQRYKQVVKAMRSATSPAWESKRATFSRSWRQPGR
jgi:hypothetical protein